jgi:hypothetical protein
MAGSVSLDLRGQTAEITTLTNHLMMKVHAQGGRLTVRDHAALIAGGDRIEVVFDDLDAAQAAAAVQAILGQIPNGRRLVSLVATP